MSVDVYHSVRQRLLGSPVRKAVMLALADRSEDDHWTTFVGQERGAAEAEIGVRTWRRTLAEFETEGLISRVHRYRKDGTRTSDLIRLNKAAIEALPLVIPEQPAAVAGSDEQPAGVAGSEDDYRPTTPDYRPEATDLPAADDSTTGRPGRVINRGTNRATISQETIRAHARAGVSSTGYEVAVRQPDGSVRMEWRDDGLTYEERLNKTFERSFR